MARHGECACLCIGAGTITSVRDPSLRRVLHQLGELHVSVAALGPEDEEEANTGQQPDAGLGQEHCACRGHCHCIVIVILLLVMVIVMNIDYH